MGLNRLSESELMEWLASSCQAQGVDLVVTDPEVLRRVGVLFGGRAVSVRALGAPAPSTARNRRAS